MSRGDERLAERLRDAAPRVATAGVLAVVARKRARRRARRRAAAGGLAACSAAALVVAVITVFALANGDEPRSDARVYSGSDVSEGRWTSQAPEPIALAPEQGYVRGPLVVAGSTLMLSAYEPDGESYRFPPSRIVRVDGRTFREEGRVDLRAEILSIADGEGARWAVTRNPPPAGGLPDAFLKRIDADGAVTSAVLPPGSEPVGPVAAGAGGVWVPVRDGVLRADPAAPGRFEHVALAPAGSRAVVVAQGRAWVTDENAVRPLGNDPGFDTPAPVLAPAGEQLVGLAVTGPDGQLRLLTRDATSGAAHVDGHALPRGFAATALRSSGDRLWAEGTVDGSPAIALLGSDGRSVATVALDRGRDTSFAWVHPHVVVAASSGQLLRIRVGAAQ